MFANLLNNATKYTERGGQIRVTASAEGERAVVTVADTGAGIPPDMLPRIFDMFTQVQEFRDRRQGGLGIGLTLAKRLVELHGGTIEAQSEGPGRGSTFIVRHAASAHPYGRALTIRTSPKQRARNAASWSPKTTPTPLR